MTSWVLTTHHDQRVGDALETLRSLPDGSAQSCVTSPPYYGLRNYQADGQIGVEDTPEAYVERLVAVFREVRRVLRDDGTLWLNLGDSYAANGGIHAGRDDNQRGVGARRTHRDGAGDQTPRRPPSGLKPKDLIGIPWMVAFALRADGWFLRSDIIWNKPHPMPESVQDRPTRAHETVFLLSVSRHYAYHADAIREPHASRYSLDAIAKAGGAGIGPRPPGNNFDKEARHAEGETTPRTRAERAALLHPLGRNARDVWTIPTKPFRGAHFATMPVELAERCVRAGTRTAQTVLDPFGGAGTTAVAAKRLGRHSVLVELNPTYAALAARRVAETPDPFVWDTDLFAVT